MGTLGRRAEDPKRWAILAIFRKKKIAIWIMFCTFLEQLERAKFLRFEKIYFEKFFFAQSNHLPHTYWSSPKYV